MADGVLGWGLGAVAAGAAGALGVTADRLWRGRRTAIRLGTEGDYHEKPDEERVVIAGDGVPLHVEIDHPRGVGDPDLPGVVPTVVLVHGYTLNLSSWVFQRRALRDAGYPVVLYDQRGHGQSGDGEPTSYTVGQIGRDLAAVVEEVVPEGPVVLIGHSMGGMTLMAFAHQFPDRLHERVIGAAFVATSTGGLRDVDWGLGRLSRLVHRLAPTALSRLSGREALVQQTLKAGQEVEEFVVNHFSFGSHVPLSVVRHTAEMIFSTRLEVTGAYLATLMEHDRTHTLANFDGIETLVLNGTRDRITPPEHSEAILAELHGAEHVLVDDAGHIVMLEYPELVSEQLLALCARARRAVAAHKPSRTTVRRKVTDVAARRRVHQAASRRGRAETRDVVNVVATAKGKSRPRSKAVQDTVDEVAKKQTRPAKRAGGQGTRSRA